MNYLKNIIIILFISVVFIDQKVYADTPYFIDFSKVLNQSVAGKAAQDKLKKNNVRKYLSAISLSLA